jgi:hypothetical protein
MSDFKRNHGSGDPAEPSARLFHNPHAKESAYMILLMFFPDGRPCVDKTCKKIRPFAHPKMMFCFNNGQVIPFCGRPGDQGGTETPAGPPCRGR